MNRKIIKIICLAIGIFAFQIGLLSAAENVGYYIGMNSKQALEKARELAPDNYAVNYYLGKIYLQENRQDEAIAAWKTYLAGAPADGRAISVRERLAVLEMAQARKFAREALQKGGVAPESIKVNTIAVTDFKNLGTEKLVPYIKGLTAMIISDLAQVPQIKVLERSKIQAIIQEMVLGLTGLIDRSTAPKLGRMLEARNIAWGEMGTPDQDSLQITSTVTEILASTDIKKTAVQGDKQKFFELQKKLVFGILEGLGLRKADLDPAVLEAVEKIHTTDMEAFIQFGMGVGHLDNQDFSRAKGAFRKAVQIDPGFELAGDAEQAMPSYDVGVVGPTTEFESTDQIDSGTDDEGAAAGTGLSPATTVTNDTIITDVSATTDQTVLEQEVQNFNGDGAWVLAFLLRDTGGSIIDAFIGHRNSPTGTTHSLSSIIDGDYTYISTDADNIFDGATVNYVTIGGPSTTVNHQWTTTQLGINAYMEWGYINPPGTFDGGNYEFSKVWHVNGETFESPDLTGTVAYSGVAYGTFHDGSTATDMDGTFSCNINFDATSNEVTNFNMSVSGGAHSASISSETASFSTSGGDPYAYYISTTANCLLDGGTPSNAIVRGTVYGNGGQHTAGAWSMYSSSTETAAGIFKGNK